jgi:ribonuclease HI
MAPDFVCETCGRTFTVPANALAKYPTWKPKQCMDCRSGKTPPASTPEEARARFDGGPSTGIFTDGGAEPNPGRGGWGAVKVVDGEIIAERSGGEEFTTNNRMELTAMIEGYRLLDDDEPMPIYSDSSYTVKVATEWAPQWEANGWTRGKKREAVENLDLVQELYALVKSHPNVRPQWLRGHAGSRWNEYADALSRAPRQDDQRPAPPRL